ncbi:SRPBCC family protein [Levilactobacillus brevis]|uniref:SRPBCC family protein n=1 Tax=Levilactobacillus brevis TaxID=1580 RepID=UPI00114205ED|nr:SRPBCC family protein [Levilactobacillus brevis]MCM6797386.1 SRPBCC family protein [Levilactobacillus brevis]GEA99177.1 hypothetical protein LBR02_17420 [Levilactobacillus brevis]
MTDQKLFINTVLIPADATRVHATLTNPQNLLKWVPEITAVDPETNVFVITRTRAAINQHEVLTVTSNATTVTYTSREGRLPYQLVFTIVGQASQTLLQETLFVPHNTGLPLTLLSPIAKQALKQNLEMLAVLLRRSAMPD